MLNNIDKLFIVFAVKRSGHHAFVNWLAHQMDVNVEYRDFCTIKNGHIVMTDQRRIRRYIKRSVSSPINVLIMSFENFGIKSAPISSLVDVKVNIDKFNSIISRCSSVFFLIVNRDPYNWAASCLNRVGSDTKLQIDNLIVAWKELVKESFGETSTLPYDVYPINYNKWFLYSDYRRNICDDLGLIFTDDGLNDVLNNGGGSSFDKLGFNGRAQDMDVLNRYKKFIGSPEFERIFADKELDVLSSDFLDFSIK